MSTSSLSLLASRPALTRLSQCRALAKAASTRAKLTPSNSLSSAPLKHSGLLPKQSCIGTQTKRNRHARSSGAVMAAAASTKADIMLRTVSDMGELTVAVVDATNLVQEAMDKHQCAPAAAVALGRGLVGTVLMGSFKKDGEATQVVFKGTGDLGQMICVATSEGFVKGMVSNPNANAMREDGSVDVPSIVGSGTLSVVRSHPFWKEPYTGMVPLATGEIAEDMAQYLLNSEQQQCALAAAVTFNQDGTVAAAGGFLIRALPLISDESIDFLERNIAGLPSITSLLMEGATCSEITDMLLKDIGASPGPESLEPKYGPCDESELRDRMKRAVASLGKEEVIEILEEQGSVELTCDFCKHTVKFPPEEVLATLEAANAK